MKYAMSSEAVANSHKFLGPQTKMVCSEENGDFNITCLNQDSNYVYITVFIVAH